jgi:hypothetical protein
MAAVSSALAAGVLLSGCIQSHLRDQADFGDAARQDRAAQIADPEAHYVGVPAPASSGLRADAAQERYIHGTVIQPANMETSTVTQSGNGSNNGGATGAPPPTSGQ